MDAHEALLRALGRIAEILVEKEAKADLNAILAALQELRDAAYQQGYDDAVQALDERDNAAAERSYPFETED
jgi:hypothetical protein